MPSLAASGPNAEQITYWNEQAGPKWVRMQARLDAQLAPLGRATMDHAAITAGERVLDVGCGCGETSLELARRVGVRGRVLGIDISTVMLERARERARDLEQLSFLAADAQTHAFEPASFDVIFSRFGVMFFSDPRAAFRNLAAALAPGGRLAFNCWRTFAENAWMTVPFTAALAHVPPPAPPAPDAPGPFAFADAERVRGILADAGLAEINFEARDDVLTLGGGGLDEAVDLAVNMGPVSMALREADPETVRRVTASVREALGPYAGPDGVRLASAGWIVTARKL